MTRKCQISGKTAQVGCNVSHAHNKTKRTFLPNLQSLSFFSESLGKRIRLRATPRSMKTIEFHGGIDAWLLKKPNAKLPKQLVKIKKHILKRQAQNNQKEKNDKQET